MSNKVFPPATSGLTTSPGVHCIEWSNTKTPVFSTTTVESVSGREYRIGLRTLPRWRFSVTFPKLLTNDPVGEDQAKDIMAFFLEHRGSFESFLFQDTHDYQATDETIAFGISGIKSYQIIHTIGSVGGVGGWAYPITEIESGTLTVKVDGVAKTEGTHYTENKGVITFTSGNEPSAGQVITASYRFYFRVRFVDDEMEFTHVFSNLLKTGTISLISVIGE